MTTMMTKEYLRRMGRARNKGEASHDLSRFLSFGKEACWRDASFAIRPYVPLFVGLAQRCRQEAPCGGFKSKRHRQSQEALPLI